MIRCLAECGHHARTYHKGAWAVSIMEQTREKFLAAFKSFGYKKGTAIGILADVLNENISFAAKTNTLL